jgi:SNW domain-containing protein 1
LDTGFGHEDDYNVYDKPLFTDRTAASIYKNVKEVNEDEDVEGDGGDVKKVLNSSSNPNRGFEGVDHTKGARTKPVEFEKRRLEGDDEKFETGGMKDQKEMGEAYKRRRME